MKMELWIRTQDRMNLVKINQVSLNYQNNKQIIANYIPEIYENSSCYYELLGTYKTKERAIEVLDEIQDELISSDFMPIEKNEEVVLTCGSARIYEMPEDWGKDWYYA